MKISISIHKDSLYTTTVIFCSLFFHLVTRIVEQNTGLKSSKQTQERDTVKTWHVITESFAECQLLGTLSCFGRITVTKL